jgi:hypothetical protein
MQNPLPISYTVHLHPPLLPSRDFGPQEAPLEPVSHIVLTPPRRD